MSSNNRLGLNIIKSTVLHTAQNIYSRSLVRNGIVKIDGGVLTESSSVKTPELCSTTCSHSLTTKSAPTIFRKLWVDSEAVIGSELCYRSSPSSTFVKQLSFPMFNSALLYLETVSWRETLEWFKYCRVPPSVFCTCSDGTIGCPSERKLIGFKWKKYAGYWRTAQPKRSLQQKSLDTFGRGFDSRKWSPLQYTFYWYMELLRSR